MAKDKRMVNEVVTVIVRLELPEHIYDIYAEEALKRGREPEQIMGERLNRCKGISGSGIYFNDDQKKRLGNVVGHTVNDAEGALQRLETATIVDVSGFQFELDPRLIQRLKTRVYRGEHYEDVVYREIVRGLMNFAGMNPPLSNTGGWWRRGLRKAIEAHPKPNGASTASVAPANGIPKETNEQSKGNASVV